jgi:hypothetical protein
VSLFVPGTWAGQGYRAAAELPAGEIIERLCA